MKKLLGLIFFIILAMNVYADNAKIISQYLVRANVLSEMTSSVIAIEVENIRREGYNVVFLTSNEWSPNEWLNYMARLSIRNRTWYRADIGAVYRTNLVSNTGRRYVVFTCITQGEYYTGSSELSGNVDYIVQGYEISG